MERRRPVVHRRDSCVARLYRRWRYSRRSPRQPEYYGGVMDLEGKKNGPRGAEAGLRVGVCSLMDGYEVKLYLSEDDGCYVAQIVEFIGCAADGPSPEEALADLREVKRAWIEDVRSMGHPVPLPRHAVRKQTVTA